MILEELLIYKGEEIYNKIDYDLPLSPQNMNTLTIALYGKFPLSRSLATLNAESLAAFITAGYSEKWQLLEALTAENYNLLDSVTKTTKKETESTSIKESIDETKKSTFNATELTPTELDEQNERVNNEGVDNVTETTKYNRGMENYLSDIANFKGLAMQITNDVASFLSIGVL